jgi:hypothetical protein
MINPKLRRAVDWKIFEITARLVASETKSDDFEESKLWFEENHVSDVIEERFISDLCGYPLCNNILNEASKSALYRVDYDNKKIYEIDKSRYYCCSKCLEAVEIWIRQLSPISIYLRPIAKSIDMTSIPDKNIDDILNVLSSSYSSTAVLPDLKQTMPEEVNNIQPPMYSHPNISDSGKLCVDIINGQPLLQQHVSTGPSTISNSNSKDENGVRKQNMDVDIDAIFQTMKALQAKYDPKIISGGSSLTSPENKQHLDHNNIENKAPETKRREIKPRRVFPSQMKSENREQIEGRSIDQSLTSTNDQTKTDSSQIGINSAYPQSMEVPQDTVNSESKKSKRTITWDLENLNLSETSSKQASSKNTNTKVIQRPVVSLQIKERPNPQPLSVNALKTKREPDADTFTHLAVEGHVPLIKDSF